MKHLHSLATALTFFSTININVAETPIDILPATPLDQTKTISQQVSSEVKSSFMQQVLSNQSIFYSAGSQAIMRIIPLLIQDLSDGKLDGKVFGKQVAYAKELEDILGIKLEDLDFNLTVLSNEELHSTMVDRLIRLGSDIVKVVSASNSSPVSIITAVASVTHDRFYNARVILAKELLRESKRIIDLEMGNGEIDGLDAENKPIDWKVEINKSVNLVLKRTLAQAL
jgi:hypothetical protein